MSVKPKTPMKWIEDKSTGIVPEPAAPKRPWGAIVIVFILMLLVAAGIYIFGEKEGASNGSRQPAPVAQSGSRT